MDPRPAPHEGMRAAVLVGTGARDQGLERRCSGRPQASRTPPRRLTRTPPNRLVLALVPREAELTVELHQLLDVHPGMAARDTSQQLVHVLVPEVAGVLAD